MTMYSTSKYYDKKPSTFPTLSCPSGIPPLPLHHIIISMIYFQRQKTSGPVEPTDDYSTSKYFDKKDTKKVSVCKLWMIID